MGKLLVSSDTRIFNTLSETFAQSFETLFDSNINNEVFIKSHKKLRVDNKNFYSCRNEFVVCVGTALDSKGNLGTKLLENVYSSVKQGSFDRDTLIGSYCMVIYTDNKLQMFIDSGSTYDMYYTIDRGTLTATNTWVHLASVIRNVDINELCFMEQLFQNAVIGRDTLFDNIKRMDGQTFITYENGKWSVEQRNYSSYDNYMDPWDLVELLYNNVGKAFGKTAIFMTGGEDSRINFSIMKMAGMNPTLLYGEGDSIDTFTHNTDKNIVNEISTIEKLPVQYMNWNDSDIDVFDYYLKKYGEFAIGYGFNKNFLHEFESKIDTEFIQFGYFGECYRNVEEISRYPHEEFTVDDYVEKLYVNTKLSNIYSNYASYLEQLKRKFSSIAASNGIDTNHIKKPQFQILNTFYRYRADTVQCNMANMFFYSFPFLGNRKILDSIEHLEYEQKNNAKYIVKGIKRFSPELVKVPFFSHIKLQKLNRETLELTDATVASAKKDVIRKFVHNEKLLKHLRHIYYILKRNKKGWEEVKKSYDSKNKLKGYLSFEDNNLFSVAGLNLRILHIDIDKLIEKYDTRVIKNMILYIKMLTYVFQNKDNI